MIRAKLKMHLFYKDVPKTKAKFLRVPRIIPGYFHCRFVLMPYNNTHSTERGIKHIKELCRALESGFSAFLIFVIQMKGVNVFEPNDETHPAFGDALREAKNRGVIVLAYDCNVTQNSIAIGNPVEVKL